MKLTTIILFILATTVHAVGQNDGYDNREINTYSNDVEMARKSISLKPGFNTTGQTSFRAYIDPIAPIGTNTQGSAYNGFTSGLMDEMNYIKTYAAYKDNKISDPDNLSIANSNIAYQYFDGLGRPIQTVQVNASPEGRDLVQPIIYDDFGRVAEEYLPYAVEQQGNSAGGFRTYAFEEQKNFFDNFFNEGDFAFSKKFFDNTPLNRVTEILAPGEAWHTNNKKVSIDYGINTATEVIIWSVTANGDEGLTKGSNFTAGELYKTITIDEDGKTSVEYKNKLGQVVLTVAKDAANGDAKTYYVYDDLGLLHWVLPPKASADGNISATEKTELCYYYEYDERKRMVLKRLPGAEPIYMVYDKRNLLVATQDGEIRNNNDWMFTKYDAFSRPVMTGKYHDGTNTGQFAMQTYVETYSTLWESYDNTNHAYSNSAFPNTDTNCEIFSETYYDSDDYASSLGADYQYAQVYAGVEESTKTKGLIMATKTRVLLHNGLTVDNEWLHTVNVYDKYGRVIQTIADNHKGGRDIVSNKYNFAGELLESKQEHTNSNIIIIKQLTYDRMSRLVSEKEKLNTTGTWVTTSSNKYDELGQLIANTIGGIQTVDYQYNIRGWMTHINDPASLGSDLFAMQLLYNNGNNSTFNGNISQIDWKSKSFTGLKTYDFTYDALNRLDIADFTNDDYKVEYNYDLNGNITSLTRHGKKADNTFDIIDNLAYSYSGGGNQLSSVLDAASATDGFSDNGSVGDYEYTYDDNGNLKTDGNKNITNIAYNFLNLPNQVQIATGSSNQINYIYDAAGIKLRKVAQGVTTDYIGNFIYEDDELKYILNGNGRIVVDGSNYNYQYFIKDHLGNTRVTFDASGKVLQEESYYPFGMVMNGYNFTTQSLVDNDTKNKYLYNGKELQDDLGLDWYDYGARFYDAQLGRWHAVDPLAEEQNSHSPYHFSYNNPIRFVDPDGMKSDDWYFLSDGTYVGNDGKGDNVKVLTGDTEKKAKAKLESGEQNTASDYAEYRENSTLLSKTPLTGSAVRNIIGQFYEGDKNDLIPTSQSTAPQMETSATKNINANKKTGVVTSPNKFSILIFKSALGFVSPLLDNKNNIVSLLVHEKHHLDKDVVFKNGKYQNRPTGIEWGDKAIVRHLIGAYQTQLKHPSFSNTTSALKKTYNGAVNNYVMAIKNSALRKSVIEHYKTCLNYKF